jgi:hypothetical protein
MRPRRSLSQPSRGRRVVGPGFYLWDLDARHVLRLAAELRRSPARPTPSRRPEPLRGPVA